MNLSSGDIALGLVVLTIASLIAGWLLMGLLHLFGLDISYGLSVLITAAVLLIWGKASV